MPHAHHWAALCLGWKFPFRASLGWKTERKYSKRLCGQHAPSLVDHIQSERLARSRRTVCTNEVRNCISDMCRADHSETEEGFHTGRSVKPNVYRACSMGADRTSCRAWVGHPSAYLAVYPGCPGIRADDIYDRTLITYWRSSLCARSTA